MGNVNSINQISMCHGLGGLRSSIQYACLNNKPHDTDNGQITKRSLALHGVNCSDNPKLAYKTMKATLNKAYCNPVSVTGIRAITTYKGLNYHKQSDRRLALIMTNELIHKVYGNHCQAIISLQADNHKHILHTHTIICARRFDNLKSITGRARWKPTVKASNQILQKHGFTPITPSKHKINNSWGVLYHLKHGNSFVIYIMNKLNVAKSESKNLRQFKQNLANFGINFEPFKMTKAKGVRRIKQYSKPTNNGSFLLLPNGSFARIKKHFSYRFSYHNHIIVLRDKKLGSVYSPKAILKSFQNNKKHAFNKKRHLIYENHKSVPVSKPIKPVIISNSRPYFPKVFHGKNIIYILKHRAKNDIQRQDKLEAKNYYNNLADYQKKEAIQKSIQIGNIDTKISIIKLEIAIKRQLKNMDLRRGFNGFER